MNPAIRTSDPADMLRAALGEGERQPPWQAPAAEALAAAFPELTIHERIGQGGMAAVYRATQSRLGRPVALKVMRPDLAGQPQFAERFVREARALAALANPHVLLIHDFGERGGFCYLVTEYVDGANLRELMRLGQLSPAEVLRIVPQICVGLHFAHQHGVVHRDIKPENVLVDRDGLVKLADFGLAKLAGEPGSGSLTGSCEVFGTPHYMAPEQWRGSAGVDHRADIYSLGVVLYELLTGRLPVGSYAPASAQPGVPAGIDDVVQRSLQQEPELRYQSARDVQRDVERQGHGLAASVAAAAAPLVTPARSAVRLFVGALLVLLVGAGGLLGITLVRFKESMAWQRFHAGVEADRAVMEHIRMTVAAGSAWTGAVPVERTPLPQTVLVSTRMETVLGAWSAVIVLLVLVIAAAAMRRTAHSDSSRQQYVIARLLMASPLLVPGAGALAVFGGRYADASNGVVPFLVMLTMFLILFALCRALWIASGRRTAGAVASMGTFARIVTWFAVLLAIGCVVLVSIGLLTPSAPTWRSPVRVPIAASRLVGMTRSEVLEELGPPLQIMATPNAMVWGYRGLDGVEHNDAFQLTNGIVTNTDHPALHLVPEPKAEQGPYAGMTMPELVAAIGPAAHSTSSANSTVLEFTDGTTVTVSLDGIVVHVQPGGTKR